MKDGLCHILQIAFLDAMFVEGCYLLCSMNNNTASNR